LEAAGPRRRAGTCHSISDKSLMCADGTKLAITSSSNWPSCDPHGGRAKCPAHWPYMCATKSNRGDYWCKQTEAQCVTLGGVRPCPTAAGNNCPASKPYPHKSIPQICYNNPTYAARGSGPCDSWCTTDQRYGSGCGYTVGTKPACEREFLVLPVPPQNAMAIYLSGANGGEQMVIRSGRPAFSRTITLGTTEQRFDFPRAEIFNIVFKNAGDGNAIKLRMEEDFDLSLYIDNPFDGEQRECHLGNKDGDFGGRFGAEYMVPTFADARCAYFMQPASRKKNPSWSEALRKWVFDWCNTQYNKRNPQADTFATTTLHSVDKAFPHSTFQCGDITAGGTTSVGLYTSG